MNISAMYMPSGDAMHNNTSMQNAMNTTMDNSSSQSLDSLSTAPLEEAQNLTKFLNSSEPLVEYSAGVSEMSITHLVGWLMLFFAVAAAAVIIMNAYLNHRQLRAEEARVEAEMRATTADNSPHTAVDLGAGDERSLSSLRSEGNSSRQRFLAARRAAAQKNYGAVDDPELL